MRKLLFAGLMACVSSGAMAQDASSGFSWTGAYVGLQAGYAWGDSSYTNDFQDYANYDPAGFVGGLYAGYNFQLPSNLVIGADADVLASGVHGSEAYYLNNLGFTPTGVAESDLKYAAAFRARIGYAVDRWLPYVAGGLSVTKYDYDWDNGTSVIFAESETLTGWNIGAGVEYAATDNLIVRAEYRYSDFGSKDIFQPWDGGTASTTDLKTHDVRLGVAYKF